MVTETIISQHINAHVKDIDFEDPAFIEFMLANNNEDILKKEYGLKLDVKKHTRKNSNPLNLRTFAEIQVSPLKLYNLGNK